MPTITTRLGKGSPLTFAELDANFTNLNGAALPPIGTEGFVLTVVSGNAAWAAATGSAQEAIQRSWMGV